MSYDSYDKFYDVIVAGDTLAAVSCAASCAAGGAKTLLVSRRPYCGYEITGAYANGPLERGICDISDKFIAALEKRGAWKAGAFCPVAAEFAIVELLKDTGVDVLMYSTPVAFATSENRVTGLIAAGKSGPEMLRAKVVVDATENLSLCAAAGAAVDGGQYKQYTTLVMSLVDGEIDTAEAFGDDKLEIRFDKSIWSGDYYLRYSVDEQSAYRDLHAPAVLEYVRKNIPAAQPAGVSAMPTDLLRVGAAPAADSCQLPTGAIAAGAYKYELADMFTAGVDASVSAAKLASEAAAAASAEAATLMPQDHGESYDILIAGGGTAGAVAAIVAARLGSNVVIVEPTYMLGGIATGGGISYYHFGCPGGIQDEIDQRTDELAPTFASTLAYHGFSTFSRRVVLLQMAREAGVKILFGSLVTAVESKPAVTTAISTAGGDTTQMMQPESVTIVRDGVAERISAKVYMDCTGDGDLAAMAGAEFSVGRAGDGCSHAYSQSAGKVHKLDDGTYKNGVTNFDAGYVDPEDPTDLTRARLLGLEYLDFDSWSDSDRWSWIISQIGLRQSRQILGDYVITLADEVSARRFDDGIGFALSHYDNHAIDYENESDAAVLWVWMMGQWHTQIGCEIPYRSLLPHNLEGVLVACRALSLSQDAHHQLRMQRDIHRIAEGAAVAAVLAVKTGVTPRNIDIAELRKQLTDRGCLNEEHRPKPAIKELPVGQLSELLESDEPNPQLWPLVAGSVDADATALAVLKKALTSDKPLARFQAAALLAMSADLSGVDVLVDAVKNRLDNPSEKYNTAPLWITSMIMLGRCGDNAAADDSAMASAVDALCDVVTDAKTEYRQVIAALRALGRIASPKAEAAIRTALKRDDLEFDLPYRHWGGSKTKPLDDNRWRLQNACAAALKNIGAEGWEDIVRPHLKDPRAYIRRAARDLLEENA